MFGLFIRDVVLFQGIQRKGQIKLVETTCKRSQPVSLLTAWNLAVHGNYGQLSDVQIGWKWKFPAFDVWVTIQGRALQGLEFQGVVQHMYDCVERVHLLCKQGEHGPSAPDVFPYGSLIGCSQW